MPVLTAFFIIFAFVFIYVGILSFLIECGYVVRDIVGLFKARSAARAKSDREWRERVFNIDGREQF